MIVIITLTKGDKRHTFENVVLPFVNDWYIDGIRTTAKTAHLIMNELEKSGYIKKGGEK